MLAQQEAINDFMLHKLQSNPENDIGLMSIGGTRPNVVVPLCREQMTLQKKLFALQCTGSVDPYTALRIGALMLKNRQEKHHSKRVVLFFGSQLNATKTANSSKRLTTLGQNFRKTNISLDLIIFGSQDEIKFGTEFFEPLKKILGDNCQLSTAISGTSLSSLLLPIDTVQHTSNAVILPQNGEDDPELAYAIQLSLQDYQQQKQSNDLSTHKNAKDENSKLVPLESKISKERIEQKSNIDVQPKQMDLTCKQNEAKVQKTNSKNELNKVIVKKEILSNNKFDGISKSKIGNSSIENSSSQISVYKSALSNCGNSKERIPSSFSSKSSISNSIGKSKLNLFEEELLEKLLSSKYFKHLKSTWLKQRRLNTKKVRLSQTESPSSKRTENSSSSGKLQSSIIRQPPRMANSRLSIGSSRVKVYEPSSKESKRYRGKIKDMLTTKANLVEKLSSNKVNGEKTISKQVSEIKSIEKSESNLPSVKVPTKEPDSGTPLALSKIGLNKEEQTNKIVSSLETKSDEKK